MARTRAKKRTPKFIAISTVEIKDPIVDRRQLLRGQRHRRILVDTFLDQDNQRWRAYGNEKPVMVDTDDD